MVMCSEGAYAQYPSEEQLERLRLFADVEWVPCRAVAEPAPIEEGVGMPHRVISGCRFKSYVLNLL